MGTVASPQFSLDNLPPQTVDTANALIFTKHGCDFSEADVATLESIAGNVMRNAPPRLKFLVIDFAHSGDRYATAPSGYSRLLGALSALVIEAPVITIAWVRGTLSGRDLEFALNCSIIVAEKGAEFSLTGNPFDLFGVYAALGRKIGFVQTERLIDSEEPRTAEEMREFSIVRDVVEAKKGIDGITEYLAQAERRHNASQAVFRAQKIAERRFA